jgi:hypothetical protein
VCKYLAYKHLGQSSLNSLGDEAIAKTLNNKVITKTSDNKVIANILMNT